MHFSIDRTVHTTAFDKPVVDHWLERKIACFRDVIWIGSKMSIFSLPHFSHLGYVHVME